MLVRVIQVVAIFSSLYLISYYAASTPPAPIERLGLRGLMRLRATSGESLWAKIEPVIRWLGPRVGWLLNDKQRTDLDVKLKCAGDFLGMSPDEFVAWSVLGFVGGLAIGVGFALVTSIGVPLVFAMGGLGAFIPYSALTEAQAERYKFINRSLPYAIDLLALSMGAGLDFPGAVRQVVDKYGTGRNALVDEFTLILRGLSLGSTRVQVLEEFALRCPTSPVREFAATVVQSEQRGNPVVPALRIQAEVLRQRRSVTAEEAASKAGVAMSGPLMLLFLCMLLLIMGPMVLSLQTSMKM